MANFRDNARGGFRGRSSGGRFGGRPQGRSGFGGGFGRGRDRDSRRSERGPIEMHDVTCDKCGNQCQVPFRPSGDKPVYCNDCFKKNDSANSKFSPRSQSNSSQSGISSEQFSQLNSKLDKILHILEECTEEVEGLEDEEEEDLDEDEDEEDLDEDEDEEDLDEDEDEEDYSKKE